MELISQAADRVGTSSVVMASGASHDANSIAHRIPIGMIFVPSRQGFSHCKEEFTPPEDLTLGADVLYQTVLLLDQED